MALFTPLEFQVTGTGLYVPPKVETAEDLAPRVNKSVEWIVSSTGVKKRHIAEEPVERMAAEAARRALGSGPPPDLILNASTTPRQLIPDTSVFLEAELGLSGVASHTIHGTCLSFLIALHTAGAFIATHAYRRVLVVSSEIGTVGRNYAEPESAVLLGDGAAAAVIEPNPTGGTSKLVAYVAGTFPKYSDLAELRGAGTHRFPGAPGTRAEDNLFHMNGTRLFRAAVLSVGNMLKRLFDQSGLAASDIDLVVPHQPSKPAVEALGRWGFGPDRVVDIVSEYGNCIAASMPMALATAHADGRLSRGKRVLFVGTGAGLSIGLAILEW
jgi:3-oxoacyl-[acyl-carrier-protein] synthase III